MNWQHLMYFMATAELENFTRAAEQLYLTPSALSKAVRNLEDELGFPLFEKRGRNVYLTKFGKTFYEYVVKASKNLSEGVIAVQREMGVRTGKISIAGIYTMCAEYLPPRIKSFKEIYPDVTISFDYAITSNILEKVLNGTYDLGFCGDYELDSEEYVEVDHALIRIEELVLMASKDHWIAGEDEVDISKLEDENFIIYKNVKSGTSYIFWPMFEDVGYTPQVSFEVSDDHTIRGLAAAGLGIALVPNNPTMESDGVVLRKFKGCVPTRNQYMIWKKDSFLSPAVRAFKELILESIDDAELKKPL